MSQFKILFIGHCSYYTVSNLAAAIKTNSNGRSISVANPMKPDGSTITKDELGMFDEVIDLPRKRDTKITSRDKKNELKFILKDKARRKILIKMLLRSGIESINKYIASETEERLYDIKMREALDKYDAFNFHYVSPDFLTPLKYIGYEKKVVLTLWGSDLFQTSGTEKYNEQVKAFDRADIITLNTLEMREMFLCKFGRKYLPKIRHAYFIYNKSKIDSISESCKNEMIRKFRVAHNIPESKKIITIGYNASSGQRHSEIVEVLSKLDDRIKEKICLIVPMAYGLQFEMKDYLNLVKVTCERSGVEHRILTDYLTGEDLISLTFASEINLNLRDTDCLNAALVESLNAGSIVISGAWLPYGKLKRLGIYFREIECIDDLVKIIPDVINDFDQEQKKSSNNPKIVREFFKTEKLVNSWVSIYDELKALPN